MLRQEQEIITMGVSVEVRRGTIPGRGGQPHPGWIGPLTQTPSGSMRPVVGRTVADRLGPPDPTMPGTTIIPQHAKAWQG